jgi:DNA (cytosine-5)-methyltransferase 1
MNAARPACVVVRRSTLMTSAPDTSKPSAIDLFCGMGGLTEGLRLAGLRVVAAVDKLELATQAHRENHPEVRHYVGDLASMDPLRVAGDVGLDVGDLDLLAACPPCQGFSKVRVRQSNTTSVYDPRNALVARFVYWVETLRPKAIMMENVPLLERDRRMKLAIARLRKAGYGLDWGVLDAADYAVAQRRRRFVLVGLRDGNPKLDLEARLSLDVRSVIGELPTAGESDDPLHDHGEKRSTKVMERIRTVPLDGGSLRTLGPEHQLDCHLRTNGFYDIYGRMSWDSPAPTITAGCINPSKGRFLHPVEPRAITLREAALLQGFPPEWNVPLTKGKYAAASLIGNAIPPGLVRPQAERLVASL